LADIKFLKMTDMTTNEVYEHDGYKTLMRQLADPEFRKQVDGHVLKIERAGKFFIRVEIDKDSKL
jgi:hypothetical protein